MKRYIINSRSLFCLGMCITACAALAQGPGGPGGGGNGPGGGQNGGFQRPPPPPVIRALDVNRDGIIDSDEINNAAKALRTLETGTADQLTIKDLLGPPPRRMGGGPGGQGGQGGPGGGGQGGGPQGNFGRGPGGGGPGGGGQGGGGQGGGGPQAQSQGGGQGGPNGHQRPAPPIIRALDVNHNGIVDTNEINNAPQELRTLETGTVDQLTVPQLLGPPRHRMGGGPQNQGNGQGQWGGRQGGPGGGGQGGGDNGNPPPPPPQDDMQQANPPANAQGGPGGQDDGAPPPPPGGPNGGPDNGAPPPPPPQN